MKRYYFIFALLLISTYGFAQDGILSDKIKARVKTGLALSYFHNFQGEYVYILQQDSHVKERTDNTDGTTVAFVTMIAFDDDGKFNFLINLPLVDFRNHATNSYSNVTVLDSQTPFGFGFVYIPEDWFLGFSAMLNLGNEYRMRDQALANQFFPIASYPANSGLYVDAPVPTGILQPFMHKVTTQSINLGIVIRF